MNTPIFDFVKSYSDSNPTRLHMPGHKGKAFLGCEKLDITEIYGADLLFQAESVISESEKNASLIFDTGKTLYSTEGSTLCIKTMIALAAQSGDVVFASRNSHKALLYACAEVGADIEFLYADSSSFSLLECVITPEILKYALSSANKLPAAVYITSPDYLGTRCDIKTLSEIAHSFGVPLLVDNAHGSYLHFTETKAHPIDFGADMCCDSAHKTLPVLTGGAYLHISKNAPADFCAKAKRKMEIFASTSPSYLILQSLDLCNAYLADNYSQKLNAAVKKLSELKRELLTRGIYVHNSDPLKLTLSSCGGTLSNCLRKFGIECEYEDIDYTVLMFTPENTDIDFKRLSDALSSFAFDCTYKDFQLSLDRPKRVMSIRDAVFSDFETVDTDNAIGKICALPSVSCPPAVPVVTAGEIIEADAISIFKRYSIKSCCIVKE